MSDVPDFNFAEELNSIFRDATVIGNADCQNTKHEWQFRLVWRENGKWDATHESRVSPAHTDMDFWADPNCTEAIIQRRRKRDHLDPAPCPGIEDPVWRDWVASDDPDIQAVLISKGMPFRSLEK